MPVANAFIDSLQIHDEAATLGYELTTFEIGSPAPRSSVANRPTEDGIIDTTAYYGARNFSLTGEIWADDFPTFWDRVDTLKGALALGSRTLKFRRFGVAFDEQAIVKVAGPVTIPIRNPTPFASFAVALRAEDPRIFAAALSQASYDPTITGTGGLDFALDFPLRFATAGATGQLEVQNGGNRPTPPVLTITGPVTNPIVDNDTLGVSIATTGLELLASETAVIDVAARSITVNGTLSPASLSVAGSTWWQLAVGTNAIRLRGTGMVATQTQLTVAWRDARI